ncbi:neuropeptide IMFamide-like [Epargyreus clarus]|uniref:neuropeptide IMFamide-like n=1 Tax=Epargyreus clarus TaxID=520877 RepID=UPI003C2B8611
MTGMGMLHFRGIKRLVEPLQASVTSISSLVLPAQETYNKMISTMTRIIFAAVAVTVFLCTFDFAEANYKNAPMNGIMFGKRGPTVTEYDSRSKAFTALCEIATEACQTWFPSPENK